MLMKLLFAKIGLDLINTDHHNPQDELPNAIAVVDPKKEQTLHIHLVKWQVWEWHLNWHVCYLAMI